MTRQEIDAVGAALSTLTDDQRDAITLRFFAGLSAREAAEVMGKQEGTVRGLQFRAIAALRRQLGIEEPEATTRGRRRSSVRGRLMDDDVIDQTEPGYIELARRLEAYADLRLSPSAAATTRMRTAVMTAAHRRAALIAGRCHVRRGRSTTTAAPPSAPGRRRPDLAGAGRPPRSSPGP